MATAALKSKVIGHALSGGVCTHVVLPGQVPWEPGLDMKPEDGRADENREVGGACISVKRAE